MDIDGIRERIKKLGSSDHTPDFDNDAGALWQIVHDLNSVIDRLTAERKDVATWSDAELRAENERLERDLKGCPHLLPYSAMRRTHHEPLAAIEDIKRAADHLHERGWRRQALSGSRDAEAGEDNCGCGNDNVCARCFKAARPPQTGEERDGDCQNCNGAGCKRCSAQHQDCTPSPEPLPIIATSNRDGIVREDKERQLIDPDILRKQIAKAKRHILTGKPAPEDAIEEELDALGRPAPMTADRLEYYREWLERYDSLDKVPIQDLFNEIDRLQSLAQKQREVVQSKFADAMKLGHDAQNAIEHGIATKLAGQASELLDSFDALSTEGET